MTSKLEDLFNDAAVDELVEACNSKLAPSQREIIKSRPITAETIVSLFEAIDGGRASSFFANALSKTPHLLTTTPSSGGDLKR